jgi:hypothetical protein
MLYWLNINKKIDNMTLYHSYAFLIMHIIIFFLSYGIYSFLFGKSSVFSESFSKLIIYFEIILYICIILFLIGSMYILIIFSFSFLMYEIISLTMIIMIVRLLKYGFFL